MLVHVWMLKFYLNIIKIQTEDRVPSNILLELRSEFVSYQECNETFSDHPDLPRGIIDSQLCVKSIGKSLGETVIYPDTW